MALKITRDDLKVIIFQWNDTELFAISEKPEMFADGEYVSIRISIAGRGYHHSPHYSKVEINGITYGSAPEVIARIAELTSDFKQGGGNPTTPPEYHEVSLDSIIEGESTKAGKVSASTLHSAIEKLGGGEFNDEHLIPKSDFNGQKAPANTILINGIHWATSNVDLSTESGFAENPEDSGMFFQWGRGIGLSAINPLRRWNDTTKEWDSALWDTSNPIGVEWENQNEICPKGFVIPTMEQCQSLLSVEHFWTFRNGVAGVEFVGTPENLFLPAVGSRRNNGILENVGQSGSYWSSTQFGFEAARTFGIWNSGANVGWDTRSTGRPLRLIAIESPLEPQKDYYSKIETDTSIITNEDGDCGIKKRAVFYTEDANEKTAHEEKLFFPQITEEQIIDGEGNQSGTVAPKTIHDAIVNLSGKSATQVNSILSTDEFVIVRNGEFHRVPLIIGGVNILPNSNDRNFHQQGNSVVINHGKVAVPEWGATDANRVTTTGGAHLIKAVSILFTPAIGQAVTTSCWFKNNGDAPIHIVGGLGSNLIMLQPGESLRVIFPSIVGTGAGNLQWQVRAIGDISHDLDFTWWRMQVEESNIVSAWSPSFLDFQPRIMGASALIDFESNYNPDAEEEVEWASAPENQLDSKSIKTDRLVSDFEIERDEKGNLVLQKESIVFNEETRVEEIKTKSVTIPENEALLERIKALEDKINAL